MCGSCGQALPDVHMKKCGRCKEAYFYAGECQAAAWPEHKLKRVCARMRTPSPGS